MEVQVRTAAEDWERSIARYCRRGTGLQRRFYKTLRGLANRETVRRHRRAAAQIAGDAAVRIPRDRGYLVVPPDRFEEASQVVEAALEQVALHPQDPSGRRSKKTFLVNRLDPSSLTLESPILRLALRPDLLASVSAYLGLVPILTHISVFYSQYVVQKKLRSSQLLHCDSDDLSQIKVFVLCSEVGKQNGPLTVLDAAQSRELRRRVRYRYAMRIPDPKAEEAIGLQNLQPMTGPPGTVLFFDSSRCFHFGSRVTEGAEPRIMAVMQYLSPTSFVLPPDFRRGAVFRQLADPSLSSLQRLVLTGE